MHKSKLLLIIILTIAINLSLKAQDKGQVFSAGGYLSSLQSLMFEDIDDEWITDNLIHNRLNFRVYAGPKITLGLELRNRIFTGDMLKTYPDYASMVDSDRGWMDLSWNNINRNSLIFNTAIDRLWLDFTGNNFQLRIGRQRINWGQTFVWNPNDVFNAYSYFDFDYVERPGSDALRLQLYPSFSSTLELAAKLDNEEKLTAAGLYRLNAGGFDIQFLAGYVSGTDWVLGTGWSGALGSTSFRGEFSWFQPDENFSDTSGTGLLTLGFDRSFSGNGSIQLQAMYCNNPKEFNDFDSFYSGNLSARDLAFSEFSLFVSISTPVTPLFNAGGSFIYYPGLDGYFAGPSIDASLAENMDLSFLWQHFKADLLNEEMKINLVFLRYKYSF
jgi:hypothetical protein